MKLVRTLWGCEGLQHRWSKVWKDVVRRDHRRCEIPTTVMVYGKDNADKLMKKVPEFTVELVHDDPFPDGLSDHVDSNGVSIRPWHYKMDLLIEAQRRFGPVVYCDWDVDCWMTKSDMNEMREVIGDRTELFSSYMYRRKRYAHRGEGRSTRFSVSGNWLYTQDGCILKEVRNNMLTDESWSWHDEMVLIRLLDERDGYPFISERDWLVQYESPFMIQRGGRCPWKLLKEVGRRVLRDTPYPFCWWRFFGQ